ncbi:MAG: biopolymer transporter ExbD [Bacteroidia bacterium]|nr:biopolymer transporter ExbD [Bacteroidia bacterium]
MAAEVGGGDSGKKKGKKKGRKKKANPRIDMTPMVDLGFLLLTFFVLTTTMSTPVAMPVVVPAEKQEEQKTEQEKISEEKVLFLYLTGKDRIYWYRGRENNEVKLNYTTYGDKGVREVIYKEREKVKRSGLFDLSKDPDPMIVLIKLSDDASYRNMVDILDEMNITDQKKYMLLDMEKADIEIVQDYEKNMNLPSSIEKSLANLAKSGAS